MNFSSPLASVCGVSWSEDGRLMATAAPPRISLWATSSCAVVAVFPCQELVQVCRCYDYLSTKYKICHSNVTFVTCYRLTS